MDSGNYIVTGERYYCEKHDKWYPLNTTPEQIGFSACLYGEKLNKNSKRAYKQRKRDKPKSLSLFLRHNLRVICEQPKKKDTKTHQKDFLKKSQKSPNLVKNKQKYTPEPLVFRDFGVYFGAPSETRTPDTLIKSQVLYRLS